MVNRQGSKDVKTKTSLLRFNIHAEYLYDAAHLNSVVTMPGYGGAQVYVTHPPEVDQKLKLDFELYAFKIILGK